MAKRLFLLLIFSLIGVVLNPYNLTADKRILDKAPDFNAVETVEIVEEPEPEIIEPAPMAPTAGVAVQVRPQVAVTPTNAVVFAGRTISFIQTSSTEYVSDTMANRYGEKFIYGHNSSAIFGVLYSAYAGQNFQVYYGGVPHTYVVSRVVYYEKNEQAGTLQLNGQGNYMGSVANGINKIYDPELDKYVFEEHDLALMTCYGTMLGGGRATHRLVVFADEV